MSSTAVKRERFEMLMQQAHVPADVVNSFFQDGYIDRVETTRTNREWTFYIVKSSIVPHDIYRTFCKMIRDKFAHIAATKFMLRYTADVLPEAVAKEYWGMFIEWVQREATSVNGWMSKAKIDVQGQQLTLILLDTIGLELAKKKNIGQWIHTYFNDFFGVEFQVRYAMDEHREAEFEKFARKIEEEGKFVTQEIMTSIEAEQEAEALPDAELKLMIGYEIKDAPTPIQMVQDEEKKVTLQGAVFGLESKELRNGSTLFTFNITDFTDSMMCKAFAKTKEDVKIFSLMQNGTWVKVRGKVEYDRFMQVPELVLIPNDVNEVMAPPDRKDDAAEKRVEFHLHTTMSAMDGITPIDQYVKMAAKWGHKAIAVTDHSGVQCYPEAYKAAKKNGIKMIYGLEANVVDDGVPVVVNPKPMELSEGEYVIFDIETTGLSIVNNKIIEIAGVKMKEGKEIDRFATFVNPHEKIPYNIQQLTNITDDMVQDAPELEEMLPKFIEFVGDSVLVAHNARFDMGFIQANCKKLGLPVVPNASLDTLELARLLFPSMKNHRLNTLADKFKVGLENHHRAIDDSIALGHILFHLIKEAAERGITDLERLNDNVGKDLKNTRPFHCCIYAKDMVGKKNLYTLVSLSHTEYYHRVACIPKSLLSKMREGLIIASGCEKGEFYETVLNKSVEEAEQVAEFYDVLEIQPTTVNMHLVEKGLVGSKEQLEDANRRIIAIGRKLGKPVIATGNVHYLHPRDKICRDITINGITGFSPLKDIRKPDVHFRTTKEMLAEFQYLGEETAYDVVVKNTNELADQFESLELFPDKLFTPIIDGADEEIRTKCYETAKRIYGDPIPEVVTARLEKELIPIIKYGFSANYLISERLVKKSNEDGYLVGSRGSVGSSIVATFLGISEVNPLPPHYVCYQCNHSEWILDGSIPSGFDLPDKDCPNCNVKMKGDGQDIPFETFLGFKGDKVPDIDLNFSGEYQPVAHNYTKVLFGPKNVFRAGTIGTIAEKTAFGYVKKYEEDQGKKWRGAEINRLAAGCTGVKRSTGQHPGGIVVVPDYIDVNDITPVQFPADDTSAEWQTTHFDYHAFDANLLKLDILGHDDPTMMRMLQDLTGVDPTTIPMNDPKVMSMFNSTKSLGVTPEQIRTPVATYGVPEMGTKFVRQMLEETQPSSFADLLQISGLSHGTGVWLGNAQELIKKGTCTIKTVIGCRDEIMLYLIYKAGMDAGLAFKITESVRKGKGLTPEWKEDMKKHKVPAWYIESCERIEYMFPKAHAAAYVISAVRTAYFKLYHPIAYYATYFTVRAEDFELDMLCQGYDAILRRLIEIEEKGFQALPKEKAMISILEMALEMTARGFSFKGIDLYKSDATKFLIDGDSLIPPFSAIAGIGENAAKNIAAAKDDGPFLSIEDFQTRSKASKTIVELLGSMGCFRGLPESNQLSLF
ncbi:PolC-type DNA polymerase III [Paenibacillus doosanensis]|uniref:DNA polymerase III PolC-type n=1 Tax=Paenibacillus konkukensis TaxID=2020716 RepID=A0ABY4RY84_9BACL|nr:MULTISPECIES: PolC-type DNA polymerase III [Paenibacillus]MCS7461856.1 PolC-type DNA polymerase III [Paenibacillus doosanensis]UQZ87375.1 DNA polymerase III PolC-type [Paenibacillus konkukensis]